VHELASSAAYDVHVFNCPTVCVLGRGSVADGHADDEGDWFPCNASSVVGISARLNGHTIEVSSHQLATDLRVDGQSVSLSAASGFTTVDRTLTVSLVSEPWDGDVRKPAGAPYVRALTGAHVLSIWYAIGLISHHRTNALDCTRFPTRSHLPSSLMLVDELTVVRSVGSHRGRAYETAHMPTGYLLNARVDLPHKQAAAASGLCAGAHAPDALVSGGGLFSTAALGQMRTACGMSTPSGPASKFVAPALARSDASAALAQAQALCATTGLAWAAAQAACVSMSTAAAGLFVACALDVCATNSTLAASLSANVAAELTSVPARQPGCSSTAAPTCAGAAEPCILDTACSSGGHGCNAGGAGQLCRFCGFVNAVGEEV
jgi:hypothetical protein